MACTDAEKRAVGKYRRTHTIKYSLILNKKTDADVIDWLNRVDNKRGSILRAIREEIGKEDN